MNNKPKIGDFILILNNSCTYIENPKNGEIWEVYSELVPQKELLIKNTLKPEGSLGNRDILYLKRKSNYRLIPKTAMAEILYKNEGI